MERLMGTLVFSLKNFLLVLNFLSAFAGMILGLTCLYLINTRSYGLNDADASFLDPLIMFGIVIGGAVLVVSILGLCGAANESNGTGIFALKTYSILVGILILVQIIFGGVAYLKREQIPTLIERSWTSAALKDSKLIAQIQSQFSCCGWKSTNDSSAVPPTCIVIFPERNEPCFEAIDESLSSHLSTLGAIGVGLGIIEVRQTLTVVTIVRN